MLITSLEARHTPDSPADYSRTIYNPARAARPTQQRVDPFARPNTQREAVRAPEELSCDLNNNSLDIDHVSPSHIQMDLLKPLLGAEHRVDALGHCQETPQPTGAWRG